MRSEGIQDQDNVTDEEQKASGRKDAGKGRRGRHQVGTGSNIEQDNGTDIEDAEDLEGHGRFDPGKDPHHQKCGQDNSNDHTDQRFCCHRENRKQVGDMAGQKDQDADQKDHLSSGAEDIAQIEEDIGDASEDQTDDDIPADGSFFCGKNAEDDEAERGKTLENNGCPVVFEFFLIHENGRNDKTKGNQQIHFRPPKTINVLFLIVASCTVLLNKLVQDSCSFFRISVSGPYASAKMGVTTGGSQIHDIKLTDEELAALSGGKLTEHFKQVMDFLIPIYVRDNPNVTLDEYIANLGAKKGPNDIFEQIPPETLQEIRDYIAHYWEK